MAKGKGNPGAGRPAGSKNKRTLAAEAMRERILEEGKSPLEVMVDGMRTALQRAGKLETDLAKIQVDAGMDADRIKALAELYAESRRYIMAAHECAKDAAPYLHPKLANLTVEGSISHAWEDVLAQLDDNDTESPEWMAQTNSRAN
jgi:hypothetical protein